MNQAIFSDLAATTLTRDSALRQQQALRFLKVQVGKGVNVSIYFPAVAELLTTPDVAQEVKRGALEVLEGYLRNASLREQCSSFSDLLSTVWNVFKGTTDEPSAAAAVRALTNIAPDDFARFLRDVSPDAVITRSFEHRVPTIRAFAVHRFGDGLVRAWPCIVACQDEPLRDSCTEALRAICGRISETDPALRAAAGAVLDSLLAVYLAIEPPAFAPLTVLHVSWMFASVYATLLLDLLRDLDAAFLGMCAAQDAATCVLPECRWIPVSDEGAGQSIAPGQALQPAGAVDPTEWPVLAVEAAALRAGMVWILVHGGGLARRPLMDDRYDDETDHVGSLIWDLVREESASSGGGGRQVRRHDSITHRELRTEHAPLEVLVQKAIEASSRQGGSWRISFAHCRVKLLHALLALACGAGAVADRLLVAAEAIVHVAQGDIPLLLRRFCAESLGSVLPLWPSLRASMGGDVMHAELKHFNIACANALAAGSGALLVPALAVELPRVVQLLGLTARVLIQSLARLRGHTPAEAGAADVLARALGGREGAAPLLVSALLCRECSAALAHHEGAAGALATDLVRVCGPQAFQAALQSGTMPAGLVGQAQAACWWVLGLVFLTCIAARNHASTTGAGTADQVTHALAEALGSVDSTASPALTSMIITTLHDIGALDQLPRQIRSRGGETVKAYSGAVPAEVAQYLTLVMQVLRVGASQRGPTSPRMHACLCTVDTCLPASLWLHALSDRELPHHSFEPAAQSTSLSGPPLMVYARLAASWPQKGCSNIVLRADIFNVTGLSYHNVQLKIGVSKITGLDAKEPNAWSLAAGRSRPSERTIEALHCRGSAAIWQDMSVEALQPLFLTVLVSYDNSVPEGSVSHEQPPKIGTGADGGGAEAWSDDEDPEYDRLKFACRPYPLPLSVFFHPFRGFDSPPGFVFPPPTVYVACAYSQVVDALQTGIDLHMWNPPGFHRIQRDNCHYIAPTVHACFAGVCFDGESLVCFLCHHDDASSFAGGGGGGGRLEVRASSERVLQSIADNICHWGAAQD